LRSSALSLTLDAADLDALLALGRADTTAEARQQAARLKSLLGPEAARLTPHIEAWIGRVRELERVRRLAGTDALTGIANRRALAESLRRELARAQRSGQPLALLLLDMDWLKAINDRFGHLAGDHALRTVAQCAKEAIRNGDLVARIGGDEFAIILPATDAQKAHEIGERIRERLTHATGNGAPLKISFGVALAEPKGRGPQALLAAADAALYRDKAARGTLSLSPVPKADAK
jgi:diguanylate cyclase (GGDEF)-like protein